MMKFSPIVIAVVAMIATSASGFVPSNRMVSSVRNTENGFSTNNHLKTILNMSDQDDDWAAPKSAMIGGAGVNNAGEPPFEIRGFSLGNLVIFSGIMITVLSFAEYLSDSGSEGLNVSGLGFVYGIPVFLAGAALKYAEINPVPCTSTPSAERIFESKATEIIAKIKQDVTRHRYGDEAHLDTTVKKLGLVIPGKDYPQLMELREDEEDGELTFTMVWQSIDTPYKMWADERRVKKYETFFRTRRHR
mmetsp:Transcript_23017/g.49001  ORF Transcript_23017/g.49001 Transcript_23017/m.49001 type:complete len:247 (+) Transcript_23017:143-883(+)